MRRFAGALLLAILITPIHDAAALEPPYEIAGRLRAGGGLLRPALDWRLRAPDARRLALRCELPAGRGLALAQVLAKDGDALLQWTEPAGARSLLAPGDSLSAALALLPAGAWRALLAGEDLSPYLTPSRCRPGRNGCRWEGRLGGRPARLRQRGGRPMALSWDLPGGRVDFSWRRLEAGRRLLCRLELPGGASARISARPPRARAWGEADWLFIAVSDIFREPRAPAGVKQGQAREAMPHANGCHDAAGGERGPQR